MHVNSGPGIAERNIAAVGLAAVITMGTILHDRKLEKRMHLVRAACDALGRDQG